MPLYYDGIDYSACRRGSQAFDLDDGQTLVWPRCEINECKNNVCIGMSKSLCYPHGIELGAFTKEQFEADRSSQA